jgi:hypothetical protein
LIQKSTEVLRFDGNELVGFCVEIDLKFIDFREVDLEIVDINLGHNLSVVVTNLCENLYSYRFVPEDFGL